MDAQADAAARKQRLGDQIYEHILARIMSGEYQENAKLPTEVELAEAYGVSRPVVREALSRLRDDGLISSRQGSGSYVRRRPDQAVLRFAPVESIADVQRCFEFRVALEGEAARLAALRRDREGLDEIEAALSGLDDVVAHGRLGVDADFDFHMAVARASLNRFHVSTLASLREHIAFGMNLARNLSLLWPAQRLALVQAEHVAIMRAIEKGDGDGAHAAMATHVENARRRVFEGARQD